MADRIKLLIQKRTSLRAQITLISNLVDKGKIDNSSLKLRIARLREVYYAFENYNDELAVLNPEVDHQTEFEGIQERFYNLMGRIEDNRIVVETTRAGGSALSNETQNNEIEPTRGGARRIKLPDAPLPTFDGRYENWLSFKNTFHNLIGSRTDLSDIDKLHYLKSALIGDAANKVKVFSVESINYSNAWELLERAYRVKRIIISRHLSSILNIPACEKETTAGLSRLADDTQQHLASLNALGVSVGSEMIIHLLENKLPRNTLDRWEVSLERDEYPSLDRLYEFIYKQAVCASKRERAKSTESLRTTDNPSNKRRHVCVGNKVFLSNASRFCVACKTKQHPLYLCDKFKGSSVPERIEIVRSAKICYNCLRSHRDRPCKFSKCTICQKPHNTLLHLEGYAKTNNSNVKNVSNTCTN